MKNSINNLKNLNGIDISSLQKRWTLNDIDNFPMICNYLQKINYSISDLNREFNDLETITAKDVTYIILLVDWVVDGVDTYIKSIRKEITNGFGYSKQYELSRAKHYFKALRSIVVAHPLATNRHKDFGLDGNFICVDICSWNPITFELYPEKFFYQINIDGLKQGVKDSSDDFFIRVYSKKDDNMKYSRNIGCNLSDVHRVAEIYIDYLSEFSKYMSKQKKAYYNVVKGNSNK